MGLGVGVGAAVVWMTAGIVAVGVAVVPVGAGVVAAGAVGVGEVVPEVDVVPHDVAASPNITIPIRNFLMYFLLLYRAGFLACD